MHSHERQSAQMSKITNDGGLNPVWHMMLYSPTHMATVGVNGLKVVRSHTRKRLDV